MSEERRLPIKMVSIKPGELGGPMQEKLLVLFLKDRDLSGTGEWSLRSLV